MTWFGPLLPQGISMGSTIVKCPTTASKAIMQDRLCIGWSTVPVTLLQARPLRCFRCYGTGHGSATCTAKDLCCRCGKAGHVAPRSQGATSAQMPEHPQDI
ncbi:unnamed protein product, partial [Leptidea sinapis]